MRLWVSSFLPERACAAAHRSIQQGTADAVVNDVFRGDPVSKEGFGNGVGERFRIVWHAVFLKVLELGMTVLVFGPESWGLARNVESLGLGDLLFSCEPLCRWISGKFSAAFASSSSNIFGRSVSMCCR